MTDPAAPQERVVLGIHTNTLPGAGLTDGHAWLTITRNGRTEAYGLWPNTHPRFANEDPHPPSDVRRGIENGFPATASRYYALTPEQARAFETAVAERVTWGYTNTCASWASDTAHRVTGERVNASELLGVTDTPRQIHESIGALEAHRATAPDRPQLPADIEHDRSTSSGSFAARHDDRGVGDPETLRQAMRELVTPGHAVDFEARVRHHLAEAADRERAASSPDSARDAEIPAPIQRA